jgi:peptidoglycan hydrolase-like protein with peptidoglycan-binding domain
MADASATEELLADGAPDGAPPPHPARRGRRRTLALGLVGTAVLIAAALAVLGSRGDGTEPAAAASQATKTTTIVQQDLVESEEVDGTLGYSDSRVVTNHLSGTVTWTPKVGSVVRTNHPLFEVDGDAVYLLEGSYPVYRTMGEGLTGRDVRELENNLRHLDLDPNYKMKVDGEWDSGTTAAVKRWQKRKGLTRTGEIELGRVVFQPGWRRVSEVEIAAGASAAGGGGATTGADAGAASPLMTTTSTRRIVTVDLEATKQALAAKGDQVSLEMPDGKDAKGTITSVGTVAEKQATTDDNDPPATIEVRIRLNASTGSRLDQAPVDVEFEKQRAANVLTVPVTALLARAGGKFAVEVREGTRRRLVPVTTGLYTDKYVEITGDGLRSGQTVTNAGV